MIKSVFTSIIVSMALAFSVNAQSDYYSNELLNVCDKENVAVFGESRPKPKEGIHKIEYVLNRDLKFLVNNPDFKGTIFIECTVNCQGKTGNFNAIVSCENQVLEAELIDLLKGIDKWNVGTVNGDAADYWYLWKFKVKKGELSIKNKKQYYRN